MPMFFVFFYIFNSYIYIILKGFLIFKDVINILMYKKCSLYAVVLIRASILDNAAQCGFEKNNKSLLLCAFHWHCTFIETA